MVMSVTITPKHTEHHSRIDKIKFEFVTAADGTATGTTDDKYVADVWRVVFIPASAGDQPSDLLDIEILDEDSIDTMCGYGLDLSNSDTTTVVAKMGVVASEKLTISVSGGGDTKQGTLYLFLKG